MLANHGETPVALCQMVKETCKKWPHTNCSVDQMLATQRPFVEALEAAAVDEEEEAPAAPAKKRPGRPINPHSAR